MSIDTKRIISEKFTELFRQKGVDRVTVTDLVTACGISRQAFYYHFKDIPDVIEWGTEQKLKLILEESKNTDKPEEALRIYLSFFSSDMAEIEKLLNSRMSKQVHIMLSQSIRDYLEYLLSRQNRPLDLSFSELDTALEIYSNGICALLLNHASKSGEEDEVLADRIMAMLRGKLSILG